MCSGLVVTSCLFEPNNSLAWYSNGRNLGTSLIWSAAMNGINALHTKQAGIVFFQEKTFMGPVYVLKAFQGLLLNKLG
jgi:hypothetical protein